MVGAHGLSDSVGHLEFCSVSFCVDVVCLFLLINDVPENSAYKSFN